MSEDNESKLSIAEKALEFYASLYSHMTERSWKSPEKLSAIEKDCGKITLKLGMTQKLERLDTLKTDTIG